MAVVLRTTRRTFRLVFHQSTFYVCGPRESYLRLSYLYFRCCSRLCDVITTFVVNTVIMVFNLWLMCVIDLWVHISLCIQFFSLKLVWHRPPRKVIDAYEQNQLCFTNRMKHVNHMGIIQCKDLALVRKTIMTCWNINFLTKQWHREWFLYIK